MLLTKTTYTKIGKLLIFLLFTSQMNAATLKGRIFDSQSKEPLDGAIINDKQSNQLSGKAHHDGSYVIKHVKPGKHTFVVKFMGYVTQEKIIDVPKNQKEINLDFPLESQVVALNQVEIVGCQDKELDEYARNNEKRASNIINIISAKTIESLPDQNVADILQRVSGVSMLKNNSGSNSQMIIRGMPTRYNSSLLNGIALPTSTSLDMFGSEFIGRLEVTKSLTPDLESNAIGGTMNMVMKEASDTAFFRIQVSGGYDQYYFNHDFLTFDTKTVASKDFNELKGSSYVPVPTDFPRENLIINSKKAFPDINANIAIGRRFFNNRLGIMAVVSVQTPHLASTNNSDSYNTDIYNKLQISQLEHQTYCKDQKKYGGYAKISYEFNKNHEITFYNSYFQLNETRARVVVDTLIEDNRIGPGTGTVHSYTQTITDNSKVENGVLLGKHKLSENINVDWTISYTEENSQSPDYASVSLTQTIPTLHANTPKYLNYSSGITRVWQWDREEDKSAAININYKPNLFHHLFEFKAGSLGRMKFRKNYANDYVFDASPDNAQYPNPNILTVPVTTKSDQQAQGNAIDNPGNYRAWEDIQAIYGMVKTTIGKLAVLTGIRTEFTFMRNEHNQADTQMPLAHAKFSYYDLLPCLHLNYKLTDKQNLRLSVYQAINRPNFTEVIPYSDPRPGGSTGNPNLQHTVASCYDMRYEIYPKPDETFSAGMFYKKLKNAIEELINPGNDSKHFQNIALCTNYGLELVGIKYFGNFGINANYTYTHSAVNVPKHYNVIDANNNVTTIVKTETRPLVGQSPHLINVGLTYRNVQNGFKCSVAYTMQGSHLVNVSDSYGQDVYQQDCHNLGVTLEKTISKRLIFMVKASNLLNLPITWQTKNGVFIEKIDTYQNYLIGLKLRIL